NAATKTDLRPMDGSSSCLGRSPARSRTYQRRTFGALALGAWPREELVARTDGPGRFGLVAQGVHVLVDGLCDLDAGHHAVGGQRAAEVAVDHAGALAALGDRRDHQRLPDARVTA